MNYHTSGIVPLTRPQLVGTMTGLLLAALLAAIDQTIVGTPEPRIIAQLSGFDRYPWIATAYLLQTLFANVKTSLESGLHLIFVCSAIIMVLAVLLHVLLRSEPLRTRVAEPELTSH
jgi:hypothetical protein